MTTGQFFGFLAGGIAFGALIKHCVSKDTPQSSLEDYVDSIRRTDCNIVFRSKEGRTLCEGFKIGSEIPFNQNRLAGRR